MNQPGYDFLPAHGHEVQAVHLFVLTELFNQFKRNLNALFLGVASRVCFFHAPEDMFRGMVWEVLPPEGISSLPPARYDVGM